MTFVLLRDFHFICIFTDAIKKFQSDWLCGDLSTYQDIILLLQSEQLNPLRVTPLATTAYLSHLFNPTPIKHLSSIRLPKCKRNERCFLFLQGIEKRITKAFLQCRNKKWYSNLYQYKTILLLRHFLSFVLSLHKTIWSWMVCWGYTLLYNSKIVQASTFSPLIIYSNHDDT